MGVSNRLWTAASGDHRHWTITLSQPVEEERYVKLADVLQFLRAPFFGRQPKEDARATAAWHGAAAELERHFGGR